MGEGLLGVTQDPHYKVTQTSKGRDGPNGKGVERVYFKDKFLIRTQCRRDFGGRCLT